MYWTVCVMVVCVVLIPRTRALTCKQKDLCSCSMDDGSGDIEVSTLGKQNGNAMFQNMASPDGDLYSLNLCYPFNELSCSNAAACQLSSDGSMSFQIGDAPSAVFEVNAINQVKIKYTTTDQGSGVTRTADVNLMCNPSLDPPIFSADGETAPGSGIFLFTIISKCACPGQCSAVDPTTTKGPDPGPQSNKGGTLGPFSIGTVIVFVALTLGLSYMVGGILYMKMVRHAQGTEVVPNVSFWGSFPGLVKDGFLFTIGKYRRGGYSKM